MSQHRNDSIYIGMHDKYKARKAKMLFQSVVMTLRRTTVRAEVGEEGGVSVFPLLCITRKRRRKTFPKEK